MSGQWIPLVVALLVLQSAGMAAPGMPRKWLSRGFSVLWTLLLTPVMVMIIWRVGKVGLESNTGYLGLLSGVLILLACAFSFLIVQRMLPMGEGAGMGIGAAVMSAGPSSRGGPPAPRGGRVPPGNSWRSGNWNTAADPAGGGERAAAAADGPGGSGPARGFPRGAGAAGGPAAAPGAGGTTARTGDPGHPPAGGGGATRPAGPAGAPASWVQTASRPD